MFAECIFTIGQSWRVSGRRRIKAVQKHLLLKLLSNRITAVDHWRIAVFKTAASSDEEHELFIRLCVGWRLAYWLECRCWLQMSYFFLNSRISSVHPAARCSLCLGGWNHSELIDSICLLNTRITFNSWCISVAELYNVLLTDPMVFAFWD